MNDGKSIDETEALPLVEFGSSPTANPSEAKDLDQRRRRLIRGAAGVAPVLLTLRSGALLAASSCTGALTIVTTDPTTGKFAGVLDIQAGQVCAENPSQIGCPVGETKILTASDANKYRTVGPSAGEWTCEKSNGPDKILLNTKVAILSNASATSLGFIP